MDYSPSSREYQVFFVDYGELQWVGETEVQAISESFLELPCQAVRACLAGLELSEWEGSGWERWGGWWVEGVEVRGGWGTLRMCVHRVGGCVLRV